MRYFGVLCTYFESCWTLVWWLTCAHVSLCYKDMLYPDSQWPFFMCLVETIAERKAPEESNCQQNIVQGLFLTVDCLNCQQKSTNNIIVNRTLLPI